MDRESNDIENKAGQTVLEDNIVKNARQIILKKFHETLGKVMLLLLMVMLLLLLVILLLQFKLGYVDASRGLGMDIPLLACRGKVRMTPTAHSLSIYIQIMFKIN